MNKVARNIVEADFGLFFKDPSKHLPKRMLKRKFAVNDPSLAGFKHPLIPETDENYVFRPEILKALLPYITSGRGQVPWVFGPHGTGKTSLIAQLAARFGAPLYDYYVGPRTEVFDMTVMMMPNKEGGMEPLPGVVIKAMCEGAWLVINEFDLLDPAEQKMLNSIIEERRYTVPQTGITHTADKNFRLFVTANTNGQGDSSGSYLNVEASCSSVGDRFFFVEVDYLKEEEEKAVLIALARELAKGQFQDEDDIEADVELSKLMIDKMLTYAENVRESYKAHIGLKSTAKQGLPAPISTRTNKEWLRKSYSYLLWEEETSEGIYNAMHDGLHTAFIKGQHPDFKKLFAQTFTDKVTKSSFKLDFS